MKNKVLYIMTSLTILLFAACGGGGDDNNGSSSTPVGPSTPEGKTYQQSVMLPAIGVDKEVSLNDLKTAIQKMEGDATWLSVSQQNYTSGSPAVRLIATDNVKDGETTNTRSCNVTITAVNGDIVVLSVIQEGAESKTGIDDSHDVTTDQPAYSRGQ